MGTGTAKPPGALLGEWKVLEGPFDHPSHAHGVTGQKGKTESSYVLPIFLDPLARFPILFTPH